MPRLADGFVTELKDRIDLYDLVSRYVQLKKSGSSWVGLSPFNQEKTPSFYVHPEKGFFNCFSSGEKGDGITFVQKMENLDFYEAIEYLSREFNIPLRFQQGTSNSPPQGQSIRKELFTLHEVVKDWFIHQMQGNDEEAKVAHSYWNKERKFNDEIANQFGVGFAPPDRFALGKFLIGKGIPENILNNSGLFYEKKNQRDWVSIFCGRLMIPIREKLGRICGFTGRKLSVTPEWGNKKAPKYVNSPETPIFHKGHLLFNLDLANKKIKDNQDFLLVEGQLDAIRCWAEGFETTIAPQGTAFKETQAELLRKSNPRHVICLLDGDQAGQKAALSYIPIFLKTGLDARLATLPEGSDPDQILVEKGKSGLQQIIDQGKPAIEYVCEKILSPKPSPQERQKVTDFLFPSFSEIKSLVVQDLYLADLSNVLGVPASAVKSDFQKFSKQRKPAYQEKQSNHKDKKLGFKSTERLTTAEDDLLYCLLHDARLGCSLAQIIDPSWLDNKVVAGRILAKLLAEIKADGPMVTTQLEELLESDDERFLFQNLLYQDTSSDQEDDGLADIANQCIGALFLRSSKKSELELLSSLHNPSQDSQLVSESRLKLKEIRNSRLSPPQIFAN